MTIKRCYCENEFQDKKYGKKMRVCNETTNGYRCTVCGKDIEKQKVIRKEEKKE